MSHYPGPWHVGSEMLTPAGAISIETENGGDIAWVNGDFDTRDDNANLIAASPELLEVMEEWLNDSERGISRELWLKAERILAKVKGNNLS